MAGLLDQRAIDALFDIVGDRVDSARERVRSLVYARGEDSTPPGYDNLDSPDKVRVFSRYLSRQSEREQRGVVAGDLAQTVAQHPAVQDMAEQGGGADMEQQ